MVLWNYHQHLLKVIFNHLGEYAFLRIPLFFNMKISKYNFILPYKTSVVIYNALWETCIMIDSQSKILPIILSSDNQKLHQLEAKNLDYLYKKKIIIDSDIDELSEVHNKICSTNEDVHNFMLTICPTLRCNFRCWYCYEEHSNKQSMNKEDVKNTISFIESLLQSKDLKELHLHFFGGEPLLCFSNIIRPIVENAKMLSAEYKKELSISVTTNGFYLKEVQANYFKESRITNYQITIDGNRERHNEVRNTIDKKGSYDTIIRNIKYALHIGSRVTIRLNISEDTNINIPFLLADFKSLPSKEKDNLVFSVQKVWQANNNVRNTIKDIIHEIRQNGFICQPFGASYRDIRQTCYADKNNHVIIAPHGEIYGCTARDFAKEHIEGRLLTNGKICFNNKRHIRLQTSPLDNLVCKTCRILPICIGGCKQRLLEMKDKTLCPLGLTEPEKIKYSEQYIFDKLTYNK